MAAVLGAGEMERKVPLLINGEPNPELRLEGHPSPPSSKRSRDDSSGGDGAPKKSRSEGGGWGSLVLGAAQHLPADFCRACAGQHKAHTCGKARKLKSSGDKEAERLERLQKQRERERKRAEKEAAVSTRAPPALSYPQPHEPSRATS